VLAPIKHQTKTHAGGSFLWAASFFIPATYNTARNSTAATSAVNQAGFNERAAASGLNSGAGGQAALAYGNTLAGNLSSLDQQQAQALTDIETQRQKLSSQYNSAIAQAIADNDYQKAQALYNEGVRVDNALMQKQYEQAQLDQNQQSINQSASQYQQSLDWEKQQAQTSQNSTQWSQNYSIAQTLLAEGNASGLKALGIDDATIAGIQSYLDSQKKNNGWYVGYYRRRWFQHDER
jgi:hypothetical protein